MACLVATVSKDKILEVNEAAAPSSTKKEKIWLIGVYSVKKRFLPFLPKKRSPYHCQLKRKQSLTK